MPSLATHSNSAASMLNGVDAFSPSLTPNGQTTSSGGGRIRAGQTTSRSPRYTASRASAANTRGCECPNCVELAQQGQF